jgi:UDP-GlcNAc3NAcA epimerase
MIKILTIIGARPQIIKAAALSKAIKSYSDKIKEIIVHTGQHYDENMSNVFFSELGIPVPDYNLGVGSGNHGEQTAKMITGLEEILLKEKPECIVLYGDTNSTLAGAIAASKIHIPVVHIEAGLRSFNKAMPEEINRIACDHVSTLLFSPTKSGIINLEKEGFKLNNQPPFHIDNPGVFHCGDIMYDNSLYYSEIAGQKTTILNDHQLSGNDFLLVTIHRNNNTDEPARLNAIFSALQKISIDKSLKIVLPLHPRTSSLLEKNVEKHLLAEIRENTNFKIIAPASFLEMIALEKNARMIITDSGGVQKEAFFFQKPCIILRDETEWIELVQNGNAMLVGADEIKILKSFNDLYSKTDFSWPEMFGDGKAAYFICEQMIKNFYKSN